MGRRYQGRPTKLTPERQEKIVNAIASGVYFETACAYAGITATCGHLWLQRGRGIHPTRSQLSIYVNFVNAVEKAQADSEALRVARIKQAGQGGQVLKEEIIEIPGEIITKANGEIIERPTTQEIRRTYSQAQWQADAWYLERRYPQRWGRQDRIDIHLFIEREVERIRNDAELTEEEKSQLIRDIEDYALGRSES
jgi:transposase